MRPSVPLFHTAGMRLGPRLFDTVWKVTYRNWRGVTAIRTITIKDLYIGSTVYHPDRQLLIKVYDHERQACRDYAAKDIIHWHEKTS